MLSPDETGSLLRLARAVIEAVVRGTDAVHVATPAVAATDHGGVFVTLYKFRRLRGCMGTLDTTLPVSSAVRQAALLAATQDPRFQPVAVGELPDLRLELSILSPPRRMETPEQLEIGRHGIIVEQGGRRGLFLPKVAVEHRFDRETFLARCCREKAGLADTAWRDPATRVYLFEAEVLSETEPGASRGDPALHP